MMKAHYGLNSKKIGIVLLNMGGPNNLEEVRPFLYKLFSDGEIINLPWLIKPFQKPLAWMIAKFRASKTQEMYVQIGGGSPIGEITDRLAKALEKELITNGIDTTTVVSMRYSDPNSQSAVYKLEKENVDKIILFSQYPHYAKSTTGSSFNDFYKALANSNKLKSVKTQEIDNWGLRDAYIDWWVNQIKEKLDDIDLSDVKNTHIIFSAHGLPKKYIDAGEFYPHRIEAAKQMIIDRLGPLANDIQFYLSYQSKAGPFPWTQPYTDKLLVDIAKLNPRHVIIVPLGFVSDHVETLYEIDILLADIAKNHGIENFSRVDVPGTHPTYVKNITNLIITNLKRRK